MRDSYVDSSYGQSTNVFFPNTHFSNSDRIINNLNHTATNIWSNLLQTPTQLDIDFQITDLPQGQLAEASITGFDENGVFKAGTILIDHDANGVGWFIDSTPLDNSEFVAQNPDTYLLSATKSEAEGKYDLLTTVLHEMAHLYGFVDGYSGFDGFVDADNLERDRFNLTLDRKDHPHDLLNTHLAPTEESPFLSNISQTFTVPDRLKLCSSLSYLTFYLMQFHLNAVCNRAKVKVLHFTNGYYSTSATLDFTNRRNIVQHFG